MLKNMIPQKQRVLQSGGGLGTNEAGVFKVFYHLDKVPMERCLPVASESKLYVPTHRNYLLIMKKAEASTDAIETYRQVMDDIAGLST